ncbi:MAG TPA: DUF6677 family protein [Tepidisphaeraceae bacterium]|nr:DUF6677 family protein [Tepidisphaeraceae bacterium]
MSDSSSRTIPSPLVALAAWLLPGAGYWLLGQRSRALTVGITIIVLFVVGLLIGGVRVIEVPGYGDHGQPLVVTQDEESSYDGRRMVLEHTTEAGSVPPGANTAGWVMQVHPLDEIRNKPWYIAQILNGPINLLASWGSVVASRDNAQGHAIGARSHARTNELGVLYTAVAGMLNLLAIIDSGWRATQHQEEGQ